MDAIMFHGKISHYILEKNKIFNDSVKKFTGLKHI